MELIEDYREDSKTLSVFNLSFVGTLVILLIFLGSITWFLTKSLAVGLLGALGLCALAAFIQALRIKKLGRSVLRVQTSTIILESENTHTQIPKKDIQHIIMEKYGRCFRVLVSFGSSKPYSSIVFYLTTPSNRECFLEAYGTLTKDLSEGLIAIFLGKIGNDIKWRHLLTGISILLIALIMFGHQVPYKGNFTMIPFLVPSTFATLAGVFLIEKYNKDSKNVPNTEKVKGYLVTGGLSLFVFTMLFGSLNFAYISSKGVEQIFVLKNRYTPFSGIITPMKLRNSSCFKLYYPRQTEEVSNYSICSTHDDRLKEGMKVRAMMHSGMFFIPWIEKPELIGKNEADYFVH